MRRLLLALFLAWAAAPPAAASQTERAMDALLAEARTAAAGARDCAKPVDSLVRVLCRGEIRIGVRGNYPHFSVSQQARFGAARTGFEIDVARAIASRLGVAPTFVTVTAGNRIATLIEGQVDLVVAAMGHTLLRDPEVRFIRPHYYSSRTVVVGDRRLPLDDWAAIRGRTVCVSLGNANSATLAGRGARLLIFDNPEQMLDALRMDVCTLAAQDDSFFSRSFADPQFAARFEAKLDFSPLPWGMATANADRLAEFLDLLSSAWHANNRFLEMARKNRIAVDFLEEQHLAWLDPGCTAEDGRPRPECFGRPADTTMPATRYAPEVEAFEDWMRARFGIDLGLPMLKTQQAWHLFTAGIGYSLVLVAGALASTLGCSVLFGAALCARPRPVRLAARGLTTVLQCSPLVLLMFFAYAVASTLVAYSAPLALVLAVLMIGIYNGSYAAHAIAESHAALAARRPPGTPLFRRAVHGASVQIMSFLVNATKGSAVASMIGVPELLNALTDITSFTSERVMTYSVLLAFYALLVVLVVQLTGVLRRRFEASVGAA